jgi:phosphogluconate dehydratase
MSGASGKIPAAIHLSPEAAAGGPLAKLRDGDVITLDANTGSLLCHCPDDVWSARTLNSSGAGPTSGVGREFFANFRRVVSSAEQGASVLFDEVEH